MTTTPKEKGRAELARLQEEGRRLGASFMPLTKRQAAVVRTTLIGSTGRSQEPRSEA